MAAPKVIRIVSAAHSGSTLLAALLGELEGFFAVAEMNMIWPAFDQRVCGCGRPLSQCPMWGRVLQVAGAGSGSLQPAEVARLMGRDMRLRHLWRVMTESTPGSGQGGLLAYGEILTRIYGAIAEVAGARVIVDSSKSVTEAAMLKRCSSVDAFMLHLVRDSRAVAFSGWRADSGKANRRHKSAVEKAARYAVANAAAETLRRRYGPDRGMLVRYEDLVAAPDAILGQIAAMVHEGSPNGTPPPSARLEGQRQSRHMVGGNALRFGDGPITVRPAEEIWRHELGRSASMTITALTVPLLRRYRYPIGVG